MSHRQDDIAIAMLNWGQEILTIILLLDCLQKGS